MAEYSLAELARSGIYQIVNTVNGKRYVGSAKCFRVRFRVHKGLLNRGKHHAPHLQHAWTKDGAEVFEFRIIRFCEHGELIKCEQAAIDVMKPEYNVCLQAGSTFGRSHSVETRQKIAAKKVGIKLPPRSAEHRKAMSKRQVGRQKSEAHAAALQAGRSSRVYSEEQRQKVSMSLKMAYESGLRSRVKSEEHRQKIGQFYAKLSDDQVRDIRTLRLSGMTCKQLAEKFGSNAGTICEIANRKRYRWVE